MVLAIAGISRTRWLRWPARVYTDVFRGLPAVVIILIIGLGVGPVVSGLTGNNPYSLGVAALALLAARLHRRDLPLRHPERGGRPAGGRPRARLQLPASMHAGGDPAGRPAGAARAGEPVHLADQGLLADLLPRPASPASASCSPSGRDLNAQTGNLSPLVAAGLFYLPLTIPLTHLVNYIDNRLRRGRPVAGTIRTALPTPRRPEMV